MTFDLEAYWRSETEAHMQTAEKTFATLLPSLSEWVDISVAAIEQGGKILFFGNGGSAADAQHIAAELSIKLCDDRPALPGLCLSLDPSAMTACANDYGFDQIFARQIAAIGKADDVAVGFSTSGNSENVLNALKAAREMGMKTIGLSGETGGQMNDFCDVLLKVPHSYPGRIQEMHITLGHIYVGAVEKRLGY